MVLGRSTSSSPLLAPVKAGGKLWQPMGWVFVIASCGILYLFAVSSLGVYGIIMGGWASNSKYPFLGAIRSAAQMVSYEVSIGIIIINVLVCVGQLHTCSNGDGKQWHCSVVQVHYWTTVFTKA